MAGLSVDTLKTSLQAQIAPGDDAEFLRLLTEADVRLLEWGRWRWTRGRLDLTPATGLVTLPADYAAILAARVDELPVEIRAEEYEFTPGGPGEIEVGGPGGIRLIDQGLDDLDQRYYKVVGTADEAVYTVHTLCLYAPFTLYETADLPVTPTVTDSDVTRCPVLAALKNMMLGIIYEENDDDNRAAGKIRSVLSILDNQEKTRRGGAAQTLNVRVNPPGIAGIRTFF